MSDRPSWDDYFLKIAFVVAERSTCCRRQVGAVLVRDKQILSTGYNGASRGQQHCGDIGCLRQQMNIPSGERHELCRAVHAETNAIVQAAAHGVMVMGADVYCTDHPCSMCAKALINAKIERIVYCRGYPDELAKEILAASNVQLVHIEDSPWCPPNLVAAPQEVLRRSIDTLDLSERSRRGLRRIGIQHIGQLIWRTEMELLSIKNFGRVSLGDVRVGLARLGLCLKGRK